MHLRPDGRPRSRVPGLKVAYVLPEPELNGGNKVALQHAELLRRRGHRVTVFASGPRPPWSVYGGAFVDYLAAAPEAEAHDLVVATYWTTLALAADVARGPLVHFCQGYEGDLVHLRGQLGAIEEVYRRPTPAFVVTPYLADLLERRFGRPARVVPPPLDPLFRPGLRLAPSRSPWIAVPGIFEAEVKGVATALEAIRALRRRGHRCRVLRLSTRPLCPQEEALLAPDRFLCSVRPAEVARALRGCDLLLFPSLPGEGFGLPALEAMASGVPVVASRIPSTEFLTDGAVPLVAPGDAAAFAEAAHRLLTEPGLWRRLRRRGHRQAQRFAPGTVAESLVDAVAWAQREAA